MSEDPHIESWSNGIGTGSGANLSDLVRGRQKKPDPEREQRQIERDQFLADRGALAKELSESKFWDDLILPVLEILHEQYLEQAMSGDSEKMGGVKFARDFVTYLGGSHKLGQEAIHRIAVRQFGKKNVLPFRDSH